MTASAPAALAASMIANARAELAVVVPGHLGDHVRRMILAYGPARDHDLGRGIRNSALLFDGEPIAVPAMLEESRVGVVVHDPQQVELVRDRTFGIETAVLWAAAAIDRWLPPLGRAFQGRRLVEKAATQIDMHPPQGRAHLADQLVALEVQPVAVDHGAGVGLVHCLEQADGDLVAALDHQPGERGEPAPLGEIAGVDDQIAPVARTHILGRDAGAAEVERDFPFRDVVMVPA